MIMLTNTTKRSKSQTLKIWFERYTKRLTKEEMGRKKGEENFKLRNVSTFLVSKWQTRKTIDTFLPLLKKSGGGLKVNKKSASY